MGNIFGNNISKSLSEESPKTAFNERLVAEITPVIQLQSSYNINTRIIEERNNFGATSIVDNKFQVSTGAGANRSSALISRTAVKYNAGQGGIFRSTALFTPGVANSAQELGIGTSAQGYTFAYNGATFGVLRRHGGSPEIRTLTVSTGSSTAENITITLDGDAEATVAVTNTADTTLTANEIAAHDYSNVGQGWKAHSMGAEVIFQSYNAASQTGTYSLSGAATAVGTFAQDVAGVTPTDDFIPQTSWNHDKAAGAQALSNINQDKGNTLEIKYGWLGFDGIQFSIKHPRTLRWVLAHVIEYGNSNTVPSLDNPTLPLCMTVTNSSNTSDVVLQSASLMGGIEGKNLDIGIPNNIATEDTGIGTTETPLFSVHNHTVYQGKVNRVELKFTLLSASIGASVANKPATLRIRLNPTLTGASFSAVDANTSVARKDTSATAVSGGRIVFAQSISEGSSPPIDLSKILSKLEPGETVTVSLEAITGTVDSVITLNWDDLF